ncbi:MAG: sensor histidine kinase [Leptospiraceae bacterium]|nr:sensor histidine kinase [Leptospiraceae bacterium]
MKITNINLIQKSFTLVIIFLSIWILDCSKLKKEPIASKGVIDLRNWDFEKDGLASLNGEWEFYYKEFLTNEEIDTIPLSQKTFIEVPSPWNSNKTNLSYDGYATYRLKILVKEDDVNLSLRMYMIATAYNLYFNTTLLASTGVIGRKINESKGKYKFKVVDLRNFGEKEIDLILHVSNFENHEAGITTKLLLGNKQSIEGYFQKYEAKELILFGMMFIIGIYHIGIYSLRKESITSLYFALFCISSAMREINIGSRFEDLIGVEFSFFYNVKVYYFFYFASIVFFIRYMYSAFPDEINKYFERFVFYSQLQLAIVSIFIPTQLLGRIEVFDRILIIIIGCYLIYSIAKAIKNNREGSLIFLIGFIILFITVVNDILFSSHIIQSTSIISYGMIIFVLFQGLIISQRFSNAFNRTIHLSNELTKLSKIKDEFMSNLSHELRTPLSVIYAYSEMIKDYSGKSVKEVKEYGNEIFNESMMLNENISDLMLVTDLSTKVKLKKTEFSVLNIIEEVIKSHDKIISTKKISIKYNCNSSLVFFNDKALFSKVISIVLKNSIQYNKDSGRIQINCEIKQGYFELSFEDEGIGIAEENREKVFEKFYRVDSSIGYQVSGVGVGLYIAKRIIELMGGEIKNENSSFSTGTKFIIRIPTNVSE